VDARSEHRREGTHVDEFHERRIELRTLLAEDAVQFGTEQAHSFEEL